MSNESFQHSKNQLRPLQTGDINILPSINCAELINYINSEFNVQTLSTMQMAGAMLASQPLFEKRFICWFGAKLDRLAPFDEISPIVLAAIKMYVFAETLDHNMAIKACAPEYALIRATGKEQEFRCAIQVVTNISNRYVGLDTYIRSRECNDFG